MFWGTASQVLFPYTVLRKGRESYIILGEQVNHILQNGLRNYIYEYSIFIKRNLDLKYNIAHVKKLK